MKKRVVQGGEWRESHGSPRSSTEGGRKPGSRAASLAHVLFCSRFGCCSAARYRARWAHEAEFGKILIGPKMLTDHLPNIVNQALDRVVADRTACVSCPGQGGPPAAVA